ncbi:GlxA family transcriptional regulator [Mesorhizobium sp. M4A.F.Ca.ET.050.02.1.1]|uniref:GlxA family transcriptional regulator n=1 Tax=Mesorhizobium sp. M4A.F.Ca.ET.050.02.1.1 TaxID=2496754 RepID=UPI000FCA2CD3|nr:GlxA family transcriptional regulator [Mesorhizobium sp. M4A.F.Ca.ET.050.02.1.1]RUX50442.1 GlxA family transcriptional regulator [Mesorhizobium sp. M4A.F.Ca.ET.050.02.1.1]
MVETANIGLPAPDLDYDAVSSEGKASCESTLRLNILVLPGFSQLSLSSFVEPFYQANCSAGEKLFGWRIVGPDMSPVLSSSGIAISPDIDINCYRNNDEDSPIVIIGGERIEEQKSRLLSALLRSKSHRKLPICAIGTAAWLLADAGILHSGMRCTIHWSKLAALGEKFSDLVTEDCLFVQHASVTTCAGEFAAFDLAAEMIRLQHGEDLARRVCGQLRADRFRTGNHCQSVPLGVRYTGAVEKLIRVIRLMEGHVEDPLPLKKIAHSVGLSRRQIERLFTKHLKTTPMTYYSQVRLKKARQLLETTDMSVIEVAIACGYVSSSHFSKAFKDHFGSLPSHVRPWACSVASR